MTDLPDGLRAIEVPVFQVQQVPVAVQNPHRTVDDRRTYFLQPIVLQCFQDNLRANAVIVAQRNADYQPIFTSGILGRLRGLIVCTKAVTLCRYRIPLLTAIGWIAVGLIVFALSGLVWSLTFRLTLALWSGCRIPVSTWVVIAVFAPIVAVILLPILPLRSGCRIPVSTVSVVTWFAIAWFAIAWFAIAIIARRSLLLTIGRLIIRLGRYRLRFTDLRIT